MYFVVFSKAKAIAENTRHYRLWLILAVKK